MSSHFFVMSLSPESSSIARYVVAPVDEWPVKEEMYVKIYRA